MTAVGWLPAGVEDLFGTEATAEESYDVLTVDVPPTAWLPALETARDRLGCTYFDWLSAVDEPGTGFRVTAHVVALAPVRRLLLRTTVPHETPVLPSAVGVYAGAAWHERETHEMFGVDFEGHPALDHLLLPDGFEGHPLRKDFVLAARVAKAWPGAKEPGESEHGGPKRRQMLPPGVPDPNEWGPLKGQLPPAPARPARGAARAAGDRPIRRTRTAAEGSAGQSATPTAAGERPARRMRTAAEGSASQTAPSTEPQADAPAPPTTPRRARSASEGSASQWEGTSAEGTPEAPSPRRARSASEGSASQRTGTGAPSGPRRARSASEGSASQRAESGPAPAGDTDEAVATRDPESRTPKPPAPPRSPDAPWHHARPAFEEPTPEEGRKREQAAEAEQEPEAQQAAEAEQEPKAQQAAEAEQPPKTEQAAESERETPDSQTPAPETGRSDSSDAADSSGTAPTPDDPTGGPQ